MTDNRAKHLEIVKNLYSGDTVLAGSAIRACEFMEEAEIDEFGNFQTEVGNLFVDLHTELDEAVANLGDDFTDPDPRKWDMDDWLTFEVAIKGHKYEEIIRRYAGGKQNIDLIWKELSNRLNIS